MAGARRKSKKAPPAEAEVEADEASQSTGRQSPPPPPKFSLGPLPDDVRFTALATIIPNVSFESPSPETILTCYKLLIAQNEQIEANQRDLEELRAEGEKRDVELDQALQDRETAVRDLETSVESAQSELMQAKKEKDELGNLIV